MANFATLNPLEPMGGSQTYSEGNLVVATDAAARSGGNSTLDVSSGKWYAEFTVLATSGEAAVGVSRDRVETTNQGDSYCSGQSSGRGGVGYKENGKKFVNGSPSDYGATYTTGDVIGVALNVDDDEVTFYKNGASQGALSITAGSTWHFNVGEHSNGTTATWRANFGQFPWRYDPPSGFVALSTENLAEPAISNLAAEKPEDYFNVVTYTGTGSAVDINTIGFQPDLVWGKKRDGTAQNHWLIDSVRGAGVWLASDGSGLEGSEPAGSSFDADGFNTNSNSLFTYNGGSYVMWAWKAGGTAVSNTDGSLTTQVSANTDAGFSIITYTGAGSGVSTIGHGLNQAPEFWVTKPRTSVSDDQWFCCHVGIASDYYNYWLHWDNNSSAQNAAARWGGVAPTNSVISIGSNSTNKSGDYVCYAWHSVEGFSKFGSYTGNGSNDGPFVYLGFRPAYVMVKETTGTGSWLIVDTERDPYNESLTGKHIQADSNNAEQTAASRSPTFGIDYLSNGFKLRGSHDENNEAGQNYIYMAFADSPFKYSSAR